MTERCVIGYQDWTRRAGVSASASAEVSGMPGANVIDPQVARRWRILAKTGSLTIDFGQARDIDVLAAVQPWDSEDDARSYAMLDAASDTVTHKLSLLSAGGSEVLNHSAASGIAQGYGLTAYFLPATLSARWWTFQFDASSTPQSFTDWGKLWASPLIRTSLNPDWGYSEDWQDDSDVETAPRSGVEYVDETTRRRVVSLGFSSLNEAEGRGTIKELVRKTGKRGQVFFARDPDNGSFVGTEAIIGRFARSGPIVHPTFERYSAPFIINQSL